MQQEPGQMPTLGGKNSGLEKASRHPKCDKVGPWQKRPRIISLPWDESNEEHKECGAQMRHIMDALEVVNIE